MKNITALFSFLALLALLNGCTDVDFDSQESAPTEQPSSAPHPDYAVPYQQRPIEDEFIYMVMTDRFWNGDPSNDNGDAAGLSHGGLDVTSKHGYHGGDLKGLVDKFDYLEELGVTGLWITPIFKGQSVIVPGFANYHGYISYDYLNVDPHLGGNQAFREFVDAAHERGIKVFMDVVVNHTANFIAYEECGFICPFRPLSEPAYTPVWGDDVFIDQKNPDWLNDLTNYSNRGTAPFTAEGDASLYADFMGFDDLNTSLPTVIEGWIDVYKFWISEYKIDGFRVDTVPHVHMEFWQQFAPELTAFAAEQGMPHFRMFSEVADPSIARISEFVRTGRMNSALDFPTRSVIQRAVGLGAGTNNINDVVEADDYYNDTHTNAHKLGTFISNHDFGRIGWVIKDMKPDVTDDELLKRVQLAHAMLFFSRGAPIVYYGDEQGFTGDNNIDENSNRLDMFPSQTEEFINYDLVGTDATAADDNFDTSHPLYVTIQQLAALRKAHQTLRRGLQIGRFGTEDSEGGNNFGVLAYSRIDIEQPSPIEYLAVFNTSNEPQTATFATATPEADFIRVGDGSNTPLSSDASGMVTVTAAPLSYAVYAANKAIAESDAPFTAQFAEVEASSSAGDIEVEVLVEGDQFALVDFYVQQGDEPMTYIGSDKTAPYRIYWPSQHIVREDITFHFEASNRTGASISGETVRTVDNRRIDQVNVHYQNGNQRQLMIAYNQVGYQYGPFNLNEGTIPIQLSGENSYLHLVFQDRPDINQFLIDDVIRINTQEVLLPGSQQTEQGKWVVDLYINNDHELATTNNFNATEKAPVLVNQPDAPEPFDVDIYIRGSNNSWEARESDRMEYLGNHIYRTEIRINDAITEFKVADAQWLDADIGGLITDSPEIYSRGGPNLTFEAPETNRSYYFYYIQKPDEDGNVEKIHQIFRVED